MRLLGSQKAVALIMSLFVLMMVFSMVVLSTNSYFQNLNFQQRFENSFQVQYDLEAARIACSWEELHAPFANAWDTDVDNTFYDSICRLSGASIGPDGLYRLQDYHFAAAAHNNNGSITIYAEGFSGTELDPRDLKYIEYVYAPLPMYQYVLFSNQSMIFYGDRLYDCKGGKVHTNGNMEFKPTGNGLRFNNISELTASGTIRYGLRYQYPAPHYLDALDGLNDGMAPLPGLTVHTNTTTDEAVVPGPYRYWSTRSDGTLILNFDTYGEWLGGSWGHSYFKPLAWRGNETMFYGRQGGGSPYNNDERYSNYLRKDGNIGYQGLSKAAKVMNIYNQNNSLYGSYGGYGSYYQHDVHFRPATFKDGTVNTDTWFQIPGSLPEEYNWSSKYYNKNTAEQTVDFYATEKCVSGDAGCKSAEGWRYIKNDAQGARCTDNDCYANQNSSYVKGQDYKIKEQVYNRGSSKGSPLTQEVSYYDKMSYASSDGDSNSEFFEDYSYGSDINNSSSWTTNTFDASKQRSAFQDYLGLLSSNDVEGTLRAEVSRKSPSLGKLFGADSTYKLKAQSNGLYISDIDATVAALNQAGEVAKKVSFYNWKTNQAVTLIDIDVGKMAELGVTPVNGMIYSAVPLRLSNAGTLPGVNDGEKKAVFTVIGEESIYLKGDYNTSSDSWKLSNIATMKRIYTLSNAFIDPQESPDLAVYPDFPYIYVKVAKDTEGNITGYLQEEGDPVLKDGAWINAGLTDVKYGDQVYQYYYGMNDSTRAWVKSEMESHQADYLSEGITPVNRVDKESYTYNSLFISPYGQDLDSSLENWYYLNGSNQEVQATRKVVGSFLTFYDPYDANYDNEYFAALAPNESSWNYRRTSPYYPPNDADLRGNGARRGGYSSSLKIDYDDRFPQATPANFEAVLGFATNSWRFISKDYFEDNIP